MNLKGVWVANVTPFDREGKLSLSALETILRRFAAEGASGFVPCATTGEGPVLSSEERRQILQTAVKIAAESGLGVLAGCNGNDTEKVIALTREAAELKCNAALVVTPYYNRPTAAGLIAHYTAVANASPIPVVLYNVPGRTAVNLLPETVATLFEHPNIIGIKEASGNYAQWLDLTRRAGVMKKAVLAGDDDALAAILAMGGIGIVSASANVTTSPFVTICELAAKNDFAGAFALQKRLYNLIKTMFMETNPSPAKCALKLLGECEETVRLPLVPVTAPTRAAVEAVLKEWGLR